MWDDDDNARAYERFCRSYDYYPSAAKMLVQAADPSAQAQVMDLACGTGISTEALVLQVTNGSLRGIDPAPAMLRVAKEKSWPEKVSFQAGSLPADVGVVNGSLDLVLCSSAIWLFPQRLKALSSLRKALAKGGRLAFNLPAELAGEVEHLSSDNAIRFWHTLQELRQEMQLPLPQNCPAENSRSLTLSAWREVLACAGFPKCEVSRWNYPMRLEEWMAHCTIPAILRSYLPNIEDKRPKEVVERWKERLDLSEGLERRWIVVVAE